MKSVLPEYTHTQWSVLAAYIFISVISLFLSHSEAPVSFVFPSWMLKSLSINTLSCLSVMTERGSEDCLVKIPVNHGHACLNSHRKHSWERKGERHQWWIWLYFHFIARSKIYGDNFFLTDVAFQGTKQPIMSVDIIFRMICKKEKNIYFFSFEWKSFELFHKEPEVMDKHLDRLTFFPTRYFIKKWVFLQSSQQISFHRNCQLSSQA